MRLVVLLLALLVVGLLVARQLGGGGAPAQVQKPEAISDVAVPAVPAVPTRHQDLPGFERQVEGYVNDLAAERAKQLEQVESGK